MPSKTTPTFGVINDESELGLDYTPVEFHLVAYDLVADPATGKRDPHTMVFHAIPDLKAERVIPALARGKGGEIAVESLGRIIMGMIVPEERDAFLDALEDPNLAYSGDMLLECIEWLVSNAANGHPTGPSSDSGTGRKKGKGTSKVVHSGRISALEASI